MADIKTIARGLRLLRTTVDFPIHPPVEDPRTGDMLEPGTIEGWHFALSDMPDELFLAGIKAVMSSRTSGNFTTKPEPGDIRKAVEAVGNKGWAEAWNEIQNKGHQFIAPYFSSSQGKLITPQWSCPEIATAVAQMGGIQICLNVTDRDLNTTRSQFQKVWEAIQARKQSKKYSALPQPPQVPQLSAQQPPAIGAPEGVADLGDVIRRRKEAAIRAQQKIEMEALLERMEALKSRQAEEKRAKVEAKMQEQRNLIEASAKLQGLELQKFDLPEVTEA